MLSVLLILPDFLIIFLGYLFRNYLMRETLNDGFWKGAEKLVFYVLFPPLLFMSVARSNLTISEAGLFLAVAIAAMLCAVGLSWSIRYLIKADDVTHASAFHCGFRFNTYVGFALASRLYGQDGLALLSLLIAFWVPISNSIAVAVLAGAVARANKTQNSQSVLMTTLRAIFTNPLIIATVAGLVFNFAHIQVPNVAAHFLQSLGNASLAMGLLCIGAGLRLSGMKDNWQLIAANTIERLVAVPLVACIFVVVFQLPPAAMGVALIFAMLPTAQSCYVMTASMGGNAPLVAGITTAHTLCAMATIPCWIYILTTYLAL